MPDATGHRRQAELFRKRAAAADDEDQALAYRLRAVEFDHLADEADSGGGQVQQHGTQPPPLPPGSADQPAQQQQQIQPDDKDK